MQQQQQQQQQHLQPLQQTITRSELKKGYEVKQHQLSLKKIFWGSTSHLHQQFEICVSSRIICDQCHATISKGDLMSVGERVYNDQVQVHVVGVDLVHWNCVEEYKKFLTLEDAIKQQQQQLKLQVPLEQLHGFFSAACNRVQRLKLFKAFNSAEAAEKGSATAAATASSAASSASSSSLLHLLKTVKPLVFENVRCVVVGHHFSSAPGGRDDVVSTLERNGAIVQSTLQASTNLVVKEDSTITEVAEAAAGASSWKKIQSQVTARNLQVVDFTWIQDKVNAFKSALATGALSSPSTSVLPAAYVPKTTPTPVLSVPPIAAPQKMSLASLISSFDDDEEEESSCNKENRVPTVTATVSSAMPILERATVETASRRQLQLLCKQHGIKANMKNTEMKKGLLEKLR